MSKKKKDKKKKNKKSKKVVSTTPIVSEKKVVTPRKSKTLTEDEKTLLISIVDLETVDDAQDANIIVNLKKTKINKDLIIEFLVLYARELER